METWSLDCETFPIRQGLLAPPLVSVQAYDGKESILLNHLSGSMWFAQKLRAGAKFVGANIAFDLAVLCEYNHDLIPDVFAAYEQDRVVDVQIAQMLIDIEAGCLHFPRGDGTKGYSLAALEQHYLKRDRSEEKEDPAGWRMRYAELVDVPVEQWPEEARKYAIDDVIGTHEVYLAQKSDSVVDLFPQCRAAWALHLMCCWGFRAERSAVDALKTRLLAERERNHKWLHKAVFFKKRRATKKEVEEGSVDYWEDGPKGPRPIKYQKDVAKIQATVKKYYERRGKSVPTTDSGRIATDKDTCEQSGSRILKLVADGGGIEKIISTYLPALELAVEFPLTSRANVLVESGRTSWSKPNCQNWPTGKRVGGVRDCVIPRPGFWMSSTDLNSAELCAQAQNNIDLFGKSKLADILNSGKDPLVMFAAEELLRVPYEQVDARKKVKGSPEKNARDFAKVAYYGIPGGLAARTLVEYAWANYKIKITQAEAKDLLARYFKFLPEQRAYLDLIGRITRNGPTTMTQFVSGRKRGDVTYTQFANGWFQGRVADAVKDAMFRVSKECYVDCGTALFGSRPFVMAHDELIVEHPIDIAAEAAQRVADVMIAACQPYMPKVTIRAAPALMTRWLKDADTKRDESGRLIPWA